MNTIKTVDEWVEVWKRDGDGEHERSELIQYLERYIRSIQENAWSSAIQAASEMCGGDSHIEEGVMELIELPK
jgi:hypothetical protein